MIYKWNDFITDDFDLLLETIEYYVAGKLSRDDIEVRDTPAFETEVENIEVYEFTGYYKISPSEFDRAVEKVAKLQEQVILEIKKGDYQKAKEKMKDITIMINRLKDNWYRK